MFYLSEIVCFFVDDDRALDNIELALWIHGDLGVEDQHLRRTFKRADNVSKVASMMIFGFRATMRFLFCLENKTTFILN